MAGFSREADALRTLADHGRKAFRNSGRVMRAAVARTRPKPGANIPDRMRVADNIAKFRKARGWTQKDLAEAVGTSQGTIALLECHRATPSLHRLLELAEALEVDASMLVAGVTSADLPPPKKRR